MKKARRFIALIVSIVATLYLPILSMTDYVQFLRIWGFSPLDVVFIGGAIVDAAI